MLPTRTTPQTLICPACPACGSKATVRRGKRRNRIRVLQLYQCGECLHRFAAGDAGKNKTYPLKTILEAPSTFNRGYSLTETQQQLRRRRVIFLPGNWRMQLDWEL